MSTAATRPNEAERYYNYAYLDEQTKRMIRRAILKALAIPGYQAPFGSREMPVPYGWGTGGIQLTAAIIGPDDVYKCIDQGADDTTNAVSIRKFFARVADVATTDAVVLDASDGALVRLKPAVRTSCATTLGSGSAASGSSLASSGCDQSRFTTSNNNMPLASLTSVANSPVRQNRT